MIMSERIERVIQLLENNA